MSSKLNIIKTSYMQRGMVVGVDIILLQKKKQREKVIEKSKVFHIAVS